MGELEEAWDNLNRSMGRLEATQDWYLLTQKNNRDWAIFGFLVAMYAFASGILIGMSI